MKNKLPLILLLASGAGIFFWLRRKAAAGANLLYEPIDIAIDSSRSAASLFSRIYYNVKLRLINNERANVNIRAINLQVFLKVANLQERKLGDVINNNAFQVPAQGSQEIKLDTSISTGAVLQILKDALIEGLQFSIKITGYIDTDLGRINVNFTKDFGTNRITGNNNNDLIGQYIQSNFRKEIGIIKAIEGDFVTIEYPSLGFTEAVNYKLVPLTIISHKKFDVK